MTAIRRTSKHPREPAGFRRKAWPARLAKLLGKVFDSDLARRARVSVEAVRAERRRRGIAPFAPQRGPIEWTDAMEALLGEATDREVAAELGIPARSVAY